MSDALRSLLRARGAPPGPLGEVRAHVARHGPPGADALRDLAEHIGMPVASLRGAVGYFADLNAPAADVLVCDGTSCHLAGADRLRAGVEAKAATRAVRCLGHCHASPALLVHGRVVHARPGDTAETLFGGGARDDAPVDVRCLAPERIVTRRLGRGGFADLDRARGDGAYTALDAALAGPPEAVLAAVIASGERGRGGAAYPTGHKWRAAAAAPGTAKHVVANGDEGDPGAYLDRHLMEEDPHALIEGMALCAYAIGAGHGVVFIRGEYPAAHAAVTAAVDHARRAGILGDRLLGHGPAFDITVVQGMGSYVCGEETALLNAIEGFRGDVRPRPPYPVDHGLHGRPTVVNNVETLVNVPWIVAHGPDAYRALGTAASPGTKALCLNAGFARPGIVEVELGTPLHTVLGEGGGADGLRAVLVGGPMGSVVTPRDWDVPVCHAAMRDRGIELGHGGIVALPATADLRALLDHWLAFMAEESCGRCVPCRIGSRRLLETVRGGGLDTGRAGLDRLLDVVAQASLCAFGQRIPTPVRELIALIDAEAA
ncbi:MAG: NADH-ubiquinone oxidoreductase-F iron-sulfur binding region domain-containing protein [Actinomycetota bacterium]